ncbi:hypothetical protein CEW46_29735 [Bacillus cereus]|nr:hypothetical protein CEW46_29735 [Bacillus cereus]
MYYVNIERLIGIMKARAEIEVERYASDFQYVYMESAHGKHRYDIRGGLVETQNPITYQWGDEFDLTSEEHYLVGLK